jgi:glycyl-tRNA synthetase beta chain
MSLDRPLDIGWLVGEAIDRLAQKRTREPNVVRAEVLEFFRTRFVNFHTSRDFPLDVVEAAVRARFDDVVDARRRVEALHEWKSREDFDSIIIGFKRVVNILRDTAPQSMSEKLLAEDAEKKLYSAFQEVSKRAGSFIQKGEYAKALEIIAELKSPIDEFFDAVMVMVEDEQLRNNRLGLLRKLADFSGQIADFSFIGSTAAGKQS